MPRRFEQMLTMKWEYEKNYKVSLDTLAEMFLTKHKFVLMEYSSYSLEFFIVLFLNWKWDSRVRFEDVKDI